jgi:hypothetical protein
MRQSRHPAVVAHQQHALEEGRRQSRWQASVGNQPPSKKESTSEEAPAKKPAL